jgi:phenylacetate-CoA ligase
MSDQLRQLNALLAAILPANPFYARKLAGLPAQFGSLDGFFARVPFTTKAELVADQLAHPPYGTNLTYPLAQYTRFHQTSGTTGAPLRWLDTPASWDWLVGLWMRIFRAAGVTAGDRVYFPFSFGPFIGFWMAFAAAERLGCLCLPGGGLSSAARLQAIRENGATVLCCTPTYALHLAGGASSVRLLIVAGEPGGSIPATRAAIAKAWNGARVFDHHGLTETGPVTYEVPGGLLVMEDAFIAEVVDEELVLTNLGRTGSPLLRYRTGDRVQAVRRDGQLILEGGILGRMDDMVIVRGVNVHPSAVEEIVRRHAGIAEYRVDVSPTEMRVTIDTPEAGLARVLEEDFRTAFALRVPVSVASLPGFELKAKRWIRHVA